MAAKQNSSEDRRQRTEDSLCRRYTTPFLSSVLCLLSSDLEEVLGSDWQPQALWPLSRQRLNSKGVGFTLHPHMHPEGCHAFTLHSDACASHSRL